MVRLKIASALVVIFALSSCSTAPVTKPELALEPVGWWRAWVSTDDLELAGLADAARQSLDYYRKLSPDTAFTFGPSRTTAGEMALTLQDFLLVIENTSLSAG